ARDLLIPLALAVLFTLLLAPGVRRLESWHLNRLVATLIVAVLALALVGGVGWVTGSEFVNLAGKLPEYRENITKKLQALRSTPRQGPLGKAAEALQQLEKDSAPPGTQARERAKPPPAPVPTTPLEIVGKLGIPVLS